MRYSRIFTVATVLLVPGTAWAAAPTKAVPPPPAQSVPFQPLALAPTGTPGTPYSIDGATCQAGKPPAGSPNADPQEADYDACNSRLIQTSAIVNFPGVIFIGGAFGKTSNQFIVAPGVAIGGGASIPLIRPSLNWWLKDGKYLFTLPDTLRFNMNFIASVTGSLGALIFPSVSSSSSTGGNTEVGYSVGGFGAVEFAWTSWDTQLEFDGNGNVTTVRGSGQMKTKVAFSVGLLAGYLGNSKIVGDAFIVGAQPSLTFKF
jgi:hypothetical protein